MSREQPTMETIPPHENRKTGAVKEILPLTGIRGFAALSVIFGHFCSGETSLLSLVPFLLPLKHLASYGGLGVDFFFLLSGFILSYVHHAGTGKFGLIQYRKFLWLRIARMYPVHLATLAILALLVWVAHRNHPLTGDYRLSAMPFELTMTQAWPFIPFAWSWNFPSWSISAEWFAYIFLFPLCWQILKQGWSPVTFFICGYIFLILMTTLQYFFPDGGPVIGTIFFEFTAGSLLFGLYAHDHFIKKFCQRYCSVIFIIPLALAMFHLIPDFSRLPLVPFFPLILLGLTSGQSWVARLFASPMAVWFGQISYSMYMGHALVQKILKIAAPISKYENAPLLARLFLLGLYFGAAIIVGALLYYLVEVPSRNYLRRRSNSRKAAMPMVR